MKREKDTSKRNIRLSLHKKERSSKPRRFLLHMARKGRTWAGKVTCVSDETEFKFHDLDELKDWLDAYDKRPSEPLRNDIIDNVAKHSK